LATADLDGDLRPEILVALYKSTRRFHRKHNCLFVYGFDGRTVTPRWLGSRLSRSFSDFAASSGMLYMLESGLDGRRMVGQYLWSGFGFRRVGESGAWKKARLLGATSKGALLEADENRFLVARKHGDK